MDEDLLKTLMGLLGISTLAAVSRSILSEDRRSLKGFLRGFILAIFVGTLVAMAIQDQDFSSGTQGAVVGICAFIADDLLIMVVSLVQAVSKNPKLILNFFFKRGG